MPTFHTKQNNKIMIRTQLNAPLVQKDLSDNPEIIRPIQHSLILKKQLSKSKRIDFTPGPGAYKLNSIFQNKSGFSIPKSKPNNSIPSHNPDPWSYMPKDIIIKPKSPNATIGRQQKRVKQQQKPSPVDYSANYNIVCHSVITPIIHPQSTTINRQQLTSPGPGKYDLLKFDTLKSNRSATIGRQQRKIDTKQEISIPARTYQTISANSYYQENEIDVGLRKKRGYSMGQRLNCKTESELPLNYLKYINTRQNIMRKSPAYSFKRSLKRQSSVQDISPGPAKYFQAKYHAKGVIIGRQQRKLHRITLSPGPESYRTERHSQGPSFLIPKANKSKSTQRTPGPGSYVPQLSQPPKYKGISIGWGDRVNFEKKEKIPGPGQYNIRMHTTGGFRDQEHMISDRKLRLTKYFSANKDLLKNII